MRAEEQWLRGPVLDRAMAWSWVPFAAVVLLAPLNGDQLVVLMSLVLAFSFSHQTLTLPLVYGDRQVLDSHRGLFLVAPIVFFVGIGLLVGSGAVLLVAAVGAAWNAEHTLMQRFGIVRIYGRQVGQTRAGVEKPLLFVTFLVALAAASASGSAAGELRRLGLKGLNAGTLDLLEEAEPVATAALAPLVLAAVILALIWWRQEFASGRTRSRAKHQYLVSTMAMFALAVVNPVAGLFGFIGSHATEYYVIVDKTVRTRYSPDERRRPGALSRVVGERFGLVLPVVVYVLAMVVFAYVWKGRRPLVYTTIVMGIGATHFLLDGFIWKLRQPDTAASLDIGGGSSEAGELATAGH